MVRKHRDRTRRNSRPIRLTWSAGGPGALWFTNAILVAIVAFAFAVTENTGSGQVEAGATAIGAGVFAVVYCVGGLFTPRDE